MVIVIQDQKGDFFMASPSSGGSVRWCRVAVVPMAFLANLADSLRSDLQSDQVMVG